MWSLLRHWWFGHEWRTSPRGSVRLCRVCLEIQVRRRDGVWVTAIERA